MKIKLRKTYLIQQPKNIHISNNSIISNSLYNKSFKTLKKEIEDVRKEKAPPCSWIDIIITVKMPILPKAVYIFSVISIKIPT